MRLLSGLICLTAALALPSIAATAHSHRHKSLQVVHPWTASTVAAATARIGFDAAVYMKIKSQSGQTDRLLSATTGIADKAEIVVGKAGTALAETAIVIAKGQVELSAAGPHIRLVGVRKRLDPYDSFELTLVFERAGAMTVEVLVED